MDSDDQLAALAAGELDEPTERVLRARAARDPALARRLARFERLEAALRTRVDGSGMDPAAVARLDDALTAALARLPDEPLVGDDDSTTTTGRDADGAAGARARRTQRPGSRSRADRVRPAPSRPSGGAAVRRGTPRWAGALLAAAAAVGAVAVVSTSSLTGADDMEAADAGGAAERVEDEGGASQGGASSDMMSGSEAAPGAAGQASEMASAAEAAPDADGGRDGTAGDLAGTTAAATPGERLAGVTVVRLPSGAPGSLLAEPAVAAAAPSTDVRREQVAELTRDGSPLARCAARLLGEVDGGVVALLAVDDEDPATLGVVVVGPDGPVAVTGRADGPRCREVARTTG